MRAEDLHKERPDIFAADGYEYEDAPEDMIEAMETATPLPYDFLPSPAELGSKTERMNIRMTKADMNALKLAAVREGIPYQSLVTSVLHKYTEGRLVDIEEARKVLRA